MIDKTHRFHGHGSLHFVYQRGETVRGNLGTLKFKLNNRRNTYRLAVVVSRKVNKSAVVRNRIRRRVYEVARLYLTNSAPPYDLVFTVYSDTAADMPSDELQKQIHSLLARADIASEKLQSNVIVDSREKIK